MSTVRIGRGVCINEVEFRDNINFECYKIELSLGTSETVPAL